MGGRGSQYIKDFIKIFENVQGLYDMGVFMTWLKGESVVELGRNDDNNDADADGSDGVMALSDNGTAVGNQSLSVGELGDTLVGVVAPVGATGSGSGLVGVGGTAIVRSGDGMSTNQEATNHNHNHNNPPVGNSLAGVINSKGLTDTSMGSPLLGTSIGSTNVRRDFDARELVS